MTQCIAQSEISVSQNIKQPVLPVDSLVDVPVYKEKNPLVKGINHVSIPNERFIMVVQLVIF